MAYKFVKQEGLKATFEDSERNRTMVISEVDRTFIVKNTSKGRKVWIDLKDVSFWVGVNASVWRGEYNPLKQDKE